MIYSRRHEFDHSKKNQNKICRLIMAMKIKAPEVHFNAKKQNYILRWYAPSGESSTETFATKEKAYQARAIKVLLG